MYLLLKLLHVLAVVLFLGNIVTGLFWHAHAARTQDPKLLAHAMNGIIRSDRIFTVPAVIGIIVTGVWAAINAGLPLLRTGWIGWTLALFAVSGIVFTARVAPLQRQLQQMAEVGLRSDTFDYPAYRRLAVRWEIWGAIALVTPLAGLVLMVLKPNL
jgi:uncharacterized membrane protein